MQIVIELSDETYKDIKEENSIYGINNGLSAKITGKVVGAIQNGTLHETVTEFADRCRECGREKVLDNLRAEILLRDKNVKDVRTDGRCFFTADEIFEIIDKYRNEVNE